MELLLIVELAFAIATAVVARRHGRNAGGWFVVGLPIGIVGLIITWRPFRTRGR